MEKKTQTLYDVQYGKKTDNLEKWETHMVGHIWNMARNTEKEAKRNTNCTT